MKSAVLTTSVFGRVDTQIYNHMRMIEKEKGININVLVVDCVDGHLLCSIARKIKNVDGYESDKIYVEGGKKIVPVLHPKTKEQVNIERTIYGVNDRIKMEFLENVIIHNKKFYESKIEKKYDFVIVNRSLERTSNQNIPMSNKINKLMSSVKKDGYLLINYLFALDENNYIDYPINSYVRGNEIENFFSFDKWTIVSRGSNFNLIEKPHIGNLEEHRIKIGYLLYKKTPTKLNKKTEKRTLEYKINIK
ncbi:MAG: hypothetical protein R3Y13_01040 [bacterium]